MNHRLAPGQRVAELAGGGQRRRPGGQHLETRIFVRSDLQEAAGVRQPVDLRRTRWSSRAAGPRRRAPDRSGARAVEGRSQFRKTASGSICARVVLPTRRTPDSQTTGRRVHARSRRSSRAASFSQVYFIFGQSTLKANLTASPGPGRQGGVGCCSAFSAWSIVRHMRRSCHDVAVCGAAPCAIRRSSPPSDRPAHPTPRWTPCWRPGSTCSASTRRTACAATGGAWWSRSAAAPPGPGASWPCCRTSPARRSASAPLADPGRRAARGGRAAADRGGRLPG